MHYHLILTEDCNSKCRYCYEKSLALEEFENSLNDKFEFDFSAPCKSEIDINKLKEFLLKDSEPILIFYGGEPLLEIEKIKQIIDSLKNTSVKFRMQTNAKLLNEVPFKYLEKIDKILVSIDGNQERTDYNRGKGTYNTVIKNLQKIRSLGYRGEIIARMTIAQDCHDIYEQVKYLIKNLDFKFSSIHWQLDVGFYESDFEEKKIKDFLNQYNNSISKLIDYWINELEKGNFIKIYPFIGIINRILRIDDISQNKGLMCGAGHSGYAITTNGKIVACPIMNDIKDFEAGSIDKTSPQELKRFSISECKDCNYYDYCGGRCLYWRKAKLWPEKGDELICNSIKHLLKELKNNIPKIKELIDKKIITKKDFEYEKYFGPEIIP